MTEDGAPPGTEVTERWLDPRVRTLWWYAGILWALAAGAGAAAADFLLLPLHGPEGWAPGPASWVALATALLLALAIPPLRYRRWRYALRERDLWIRRGIWWVHVSVIPYARLQFVDTEQGPLARALGLATLVVHTAAPGAAGEVPGLDAEEAEALRERLAQMDEVHRGESA